MSRPDGSRTSGLGLLGIAASACLGCCAPLLVGLLGGLTVAGVAAAVFVGTAGVALAVAGVIAIVVVRRRRRSQACSSTASKPVTLVQRPREPVD